MKLLIAGVVIAAAPFVGALVVNSTVGDTVAQLQIGAVR